MHTPKKPEDSEANKAEEIKQKKQENNEYLEFIRKVMRTEREVIGFFPEAMQGLPTTAKKPEGVERNKNEELKLIKELIVIQKVKLSLEYIRTEKAAGRDPLRRLKFPSAEEQNSIKLGAVYKPEKKSFFNLKKGDDMNTPNKPEHMHIPNMEEELELQIQEAQDYLEFLRDRRMRFRKYKQLEGIQASCKKQPIVDSQK